MGAMSASSKVLLRRSLAGSSSAPRRAAAARRAVVVSANGANSVDASRGSAYDCECCPPGSPFLFRLPNTRLSSVSTRSAASSSPRVLASAVPSDVPSAAEELVDYLNNSWTSFHATAESARMLTEAGFTRLSERDEWALKPGGRYFFTRNMSSIVAFAVGEKYAPGNGFNIIGAHTDSPCPKLKPVSAVKKGGFLGVGVQTYGGGLWHTWFDRELSLAGSVIVREEDGSFTKKLVDVRRPLLRIPNLCIHLTSAEERGKFAPNKETHLQPILGLISDAVNKPAAGAPAAEGAKASESGMDERHAPELPNATRGRQSPSWTRRTGPSTSPGSPKSGPSSRLASRKRRLAGPKPCRR